MEWVPKLLECGLNHSVSVFFFCFIIQIAFFPLLNRSPYTCSFVSSIDILKRFLILIFSKSSCHLHFWKKYISQEAYLACPKWKYKTPQLFVLLDEYLFFALFYFYSLILRSIGSVHFTNPSMFSSFKTYISVTTSTLIHLPHYLTHC